MCPFQSPIMEHSGLPALDEETQKQNKHFQGDM